MEARYLAQIEGYSGRRTFEQIKTAVRERAGAVPIAIVKRDDTGEDFERYVFNNSTDVKVRFADDHTRVEISDEKKRVMGVESELLGMVGGLSLS
jgi:hypothetical protein